MNSNYSSQSIKETVTCPYCSEDIFKSAKKCKHCGEIIDPQMREIENLKRNQNNNGNIQVNNNIGLNNHKKNFSHFWHIILTLFTGGLWLIVWIILYLGRDKNIYD